MRDPIIVSRRRLLQSAGGVFAAAMFAPRYADAADVSAVMTTLSTYMRFKDMELRQARLARTLALQGARAPEDA